MSKELSTAKMLIILVDLNKYKEMGKAIKCPNCKGRRFVYDHLFGVFTLGMGYLMGRQNECKTCEGAGYLVKFGK